jgi:hypothetical protein
MKIHTIALLSLIPLLVGCPAPAAVAHRSANVDSPWVAAGKARSASVDLTMQSGILTVRGGASHLLDARFDYDPPAWKPTISYRVSGTHGHLVVRQPQLASVHHGRNTWDVRLADHMPIDLSVTTAPGNATLTLRPLTLKTLTVKAGAGNMTIDAGSASLKSMTVSRGAGNLSVNLIAAWKHNVSATIKGGNGNTTFHLPDKIGVQVSAHGAGHVRTSDFTKKGDTYVNSAFGHSQVSVRVSVTSGNGNVFLNTGT